MLEDGQSHPSWLMGIEKGCLPGPFSPMQGAHQVCARQNLAMECKAAASPGMGLRARPQVLVCLWDLEPGQMFKTQAYTSTLVSHPHSFTVTKWPCQYQQCAQASCVPSAEGGTARTQFLQHLLFLAFPPRVHMRVRFSHSDLKTIPVCGLSNGSALQQ